MSLKVNNHRLTFKFIANPAKGLKKQSGSMIVMALFMIVVVGLLAGALISVVSSSSNATIHQVYGVRAKQAAEAGIQALLQSSFNIDGSASQCNTTINSPSSFSSVDGLRACSFQASCTTDTITFGNKDMFSYKFSSTGSCVVDAYVLSRTVSVDAVEELEP